MEHLWSDICDEYFKAKDDDVAKTHLRKRNEELHLKQKIKAYNSIYDLLLRLQGSVMYMPKVQLAIMLKQAMDACKRIEPKTRVSDTNSIGKNISIIKKTLEALGNQYKIRHKEVKNIVREEYDNAYEVVVLVEQQLGRTLPDIHSMNTMQWVAYAKQAKVAANNKKKQKNKVGKR